MSAGWVFEKDTVPTYKVSYKNSCKSSVADPDPYFEPKDPDPYFGPQDLDPDLNPGFVKLLDSELGFFKCGIRILLPWIRIRIFLPLDPYPI